MLLIMQLKFSHLMEFLIVILLILDQEFQIMQFLRSTFSSEFEGRTYNQSGNSGSNILASKENLVFDFSFYLGRIDRLFLTKM